MNVISFKWIWTSNGNSGSRPEGKQSDVILTRYQRQKPNQFLHLVQKWNWSLTQEAHLMCVPIMLRRKVSSDHYQNRRPKVVRKMVVINEPTCNWTTVLVEFPSIIWKWVSNYFKFSNLYLVQAFSSCPVTCTPITIITS